MPLDSHKSNGQLPIKKDRTVDNPSFVYTHAKAERLATAIYLVTRFIESSEPLRTELRGESLALLSEITVLESGVGSHSVLDGLQKIVSLLDIAYRTNYISEMNWTVIRREYLGLRNFIEERGGNSVEQTPILDESFFVIGQNPKPSSVPMFSSPIKNENTPMQQIEQKKKITPNLKDKPKRQNVVGSTPNTKAPAVEIKKNNRRDKIFQLLKAKESVTVRDVALVIHDCSEKTLQRELLSMVAEGSLRKEGERRWSTYYLA